MSIADDTTERNPLEIEAQADELEAEALRLRAVAKRRRAVLERTGDEHRPPLTPSAAIHMTRAEYAARSNVSAATVSRWLAEGMPAIPVGSNVRIEPASADTWRRERGRRPTKATAPQPSMLDVDADLARAGLRVVGGGR